MDSSIYSPEKDSYLLTSVLEKQVPKILSKNRDITFLEIGCGSGIQLETAHKLGIKKKNIFAGDINPLAVKHCKKLGFNCIKSNLFKNIKGKFDIIIFNPPYLPEDKDEPEESKLATTGGKKGSEVINEFLKQAKKHLKKEGRIFLLTSNLTKGIKWQGLKKKLLAKEKIFFEELRVWELTHPI